MIVSVASSAFGAEPVTGERLTGLPEGTRLTALGEEQEQDGKKRLRVQDPTGRAGWVAADLVIATPPARVLTLTPRVATPTPTVRR